jgi:lipopolysaccharide transport system ATP-binding protein
MPVQETCIRLENVGVTFKSRKGFFRYSKHRALNNVSFEVYRGETLGVIGRNGCGKSTLLKLLSGILKPDEGSIKSYVKHVSLQ